MLQRCFVTPFGKQNVTMTATLSVLSFTTSQ